MLSYFVIQVITGEEKRFITLAGQALEKRSDIHTCENQFHWPQRSLPIKKEGKVKISLKPLFPGYLFLEEEMIPSSLYWLLKRIPGFIRFLKSNQDIEPLEGETLRMIQQLLHFGEIVQTSKVFFDENNRIKVTQGPLKGMEGLIIKVDKRKRRAKIQLKLYEDSFLVDFGFDLIEPAGEKNDSNER